MAKGAQAKIQVMNKLMEVFDGAFLYNDGKELRIPLTENGEQVQIKVALTCAKDNVIPGQDNALPGEMKVTSNESYHFGETLQTTITENKKIKPVEPTAEEKENVKSLLAALGL